MAAPAQTRSKPPGDDALVDQNGRVLGPRARGTRQRLMEAAQQLLIGRKARDLKVVDIARAVETSPATFYQYFKDVDEVLLALAKEASEELRGIVEMIDGPWDGVEGLDRARRIVESFIAHWDTHHAVLRVRNLASDEGDARFAGVRARSLGPVLRALSRQIERSKSAGRIDPAIDPAAAAAAMSAILERLAAYHNELVDAGVTRSQLVESSARILLHTVTGRGHGSLGE